ncbi:MAG: bifunctional metallophosphatase/5'-nucleotidase [Candidatus Eremiobacteraeota bacterium]|nr:bifunctional metallophosphatase/5'-nucleotidase [Candidatus Eremiobacteraeota bacterium]
MGPLRVKLFFTSDEHGYVATAGAIDKVVKEARSKDPDGVLFVSCGDVFQGASISELQDGKPALEVLGAAGYDVVEVGNHDFDRGVHYIKDWIGSAQYPVLAANVMEESTGQRLAGTKGHLIREVNGVKVGLVGVVTQETATVSYAENVQGLRFEDPVETVRREVAQLKAEGAEVIGVLSHLGSSDDEELARQVPVDFILGGHTHEAFQEPKNINGVLICQPGAYRKYLGSLELEVDPGSRRVTGHHHQLLEVSDQESDSEVSALVRRYRERVEKATGQVVSYADGDLVHSHTQGGSLDQAVGQAMLEQTGADVALFNRKLIRANLPAGEVTAGALLNALPFDNRVVTVELTQQQFEQAMAKSADYGDHRSLVRTDAGRPLGETIKVATTDFLAQGGNGYFHVANSATHGIVRDVLEGHLDRAAARLGLSLPNLNAIDVFRTLKG